MEFMAARDADGQIWAGVSYICKGIGLNKNEKDRQVKNVQSVRVLSKGCVKFDAGVFDSNNVTIALKLDFVPLWLARISITQTMERENPELAERKKIQADKVLSKGEANLTLPTKGGGNFRPLTRLPPRAESHGVIETVTPVKCYCHPRRRKNSVQIWDRVGTA